MADKVTKAKIKDQIDENLRQIYHDIATEEVPERFRLLLEQLQRKTGTDTGADGDASG